MSVTKSKAGACPLNTSLEIADTKRPLLTRGGSLDADCPMSPALGESIEFSGFPEVQRRKPTVSPCVSVILYARLISFRLQVVSTLEAVSLWVVESVHFQESLLLLMVRLERNVTPLHDASLNMLLAGGQICFTGSVPLIGPGFKLWGYCWLRRPFGSGINA